DPRLQSAAGDARRQAAAPRPDRHRARQCRDLRRRRHVVRDSDAADVPAPRLHHTLLVETHTPGPRAGVHGVLARDLPGGQPLPLLPWRLSLLALLPEPRLPAAVVAVLVAAPSWP